MSTESLPRLSAKTTPEDARAIIARVLAHDDPWPDDWMPDLITLIERFPEVVREAVTPAHDSATGENPPAQSLTHRIAGQMAAFANEWAVWGEPYFYARLLAATLRADPGCVNVSGIHGYSLAGGLGYPGEQAPWPNYRTAVLSALPSGPARDEALIWMAAGATWGNKPETFATLWPALQEVLQRVPEGLNSIQEYGFSLAGRLGWLGERAPWPEWRQALLDTLPFDARGAALDALIDGAKRGRRGSEADTMTHLSALKAQWAQQVQHAGQAPATGALPPSKPSRRPAL